MRISVSTVENENIEQVENLDSKTPLYIKWLDQATSNTQIFERLHVLFFDCIYQIDHCIWKTYDQEIASTRGPVTSWNVNTNW